MTEKLSRRTFFKLVAAAPSLLVELPTPDGKLSGGMIEEELNKAVETSKDTGMEVNLALPYGEFVVDRRVWCKKIPKGAKVKIVGDKFGTTLRPNPKLSRVSGEWGSFGHSLFLFEGIEGELTFSKIKINGGYEDIGKETPPKAPWDSLVVAVGAWPGSGVMPAVGEEGSRSGKVSIEYCDFSKWRSGGVLLQDLGAGFVRRITGQDLDGLLVTNWCDKIEAENIRGENFSSDGIYANLVGSLNLKNSFIKKARQAFDLQGVGTAQLDGCTADDSGIAFAVTNSETVKKVPSGNITVSGHKTVGCMLPYSIGPVKNLAIIGGRNFSVGEWHKHYLAGLPLYAKGILDPEKIAEAISPIIVYNARDIEDIEIKRKIEFQNTLIAMSRYAPYSIYPRYSGVEYIYPNLNR